jgi:hypothetical protein
VELPVHRKRFYTAAQNAIQREYERDNAASSVLNMCEVQRIHCCVKSAIPLPAQHILPYAVTRRAV